MKTIVSSVLLVMFSVFLLTTSAEAATSGDDFRLRARLSATEAEPLASGKAKYRERVRRDRVLARFSCEVEDLLATQMIAVEVAGVTVGVEPVVNGFADLNIRRSPQMQAGDEVNVFDADTGELIMYGVLIPKRR